MLVAWWQIAEVESRSIILNVGFKITSRVQTWDANKLLFAMPSDCKEEMITFPYLFDLFVSPFIILIGCNRF